MVRRRYAGLEFVLVPVRVQGGGAAQEIAAPVSCSIGIPEAQGEDSPLRLDVLLITRGGGSLEGSVGVQRGGGCAGDRGLARAGGVRGGPRD